MDDKSAMARSHILMKYFLLTVVYLCSQMLQKESYILNEFNRFTGRQLVPLTKKCSQDG